MADSEEHRLAARPAASDTQPLSCVSCRAAKVKCNKVDPCSNCQKSRIQCMFPSRRQHRRPHGTRQRDLLARISRLETIVANVDSHALESSGAESVEDAAATSSAIQREPVPLDVSGQQSGSQQNEVSDQPPLHQIRQPANQYLSAHLWAQLCGEVDGLKQSLELQDDSEDDLDVPPQEPFPEVLSAGYGHNVPASHAIFGNPVFGAANHVPHPPPGEITFLCESYFDGVDVVLKVLHRPSFSRLVRGFAASGADASSSGIDKATEALLFAIYFGAVTSLTPATCLANLGETRAVLVHRYRLASEMSLAKANYLNSSQLESLQAFTIYVAILRSHDSSRTSWALLGLLTRLAQSLGLHRDGTGSPFAPFTAEMRRRLWWVLVILDMRAAEDRGTEPIVIRERFDTQMPTNINDIDFGPESTAPLIAQDGPSDVTFTLCLAMCCGFHLEISKRLTSSGHGGIAPASDSQSDEAVISYAQQLEARFIDRADRTHLVSTVAARTVRLVVLKLWLDMQYPVRVVPVMEGCAPTLAGRCSQVSRADMLRTAGLIMELAEFAESAPDAEAFHWWCTTFVQWHALAVGLAELCTQTRGEVVERVWRIIDSVFQRWSLRIADSERGMLWRPIRKLYKKAKAARSMAVGGASLGSSNTASSSRAAGQDIREAANNPTEAPHESLDLDELPLPDFILEAHSFSPAHFGQTDWMEEGAEDWIDWNEFVTGASGGADGEASANQVV